MKLQKDNKGFTIIEVLIVLAIGGLMMLVVFLAVPALQRNSRNSQRSSDASRIAGAINECLSNNTGKLTSCDETTDLTNYIDLGSNQQIITLVTGTADATNLETAYFQNNSRCDNNTVKTGEGGQRAFTIAYNVETRGAPVARCIGS